MFRRLIFLFLLLPLSASHSIAQSCLPDGITFKTQYAVNSFSINYSGCTEIGGNVIIGHWGGTDITNLDGLANLNSIGGRLEIYNNANLTNMDGLANLNSIGGRLFIRYNDNLTNIDALANLNSIGDGLSIDDNGNLTNIDALANLTYISGFLSISYNDNLTNIDGLTNLTFVNSSLSIHNNATLTNIDGLASLASIGEYLHISYNTNLTNIDALANLNSIGGRLIIRHNDNLTNIDGLPNLNSVGGSLHINNNDNLTNMNGFANLNSVGGGLHINNNDNLTNMNGFANLNSVDGDLSIGYNDNLINIDGIAKLTSISGILDIRGNDNLTNIDALANLTSIGGYLAIYDNANLTDCCGIQELLSTPGAIVGSINIFDNPSSCSNKAEILAATCDLNMSIQSFSPCINASNGSLQITINRYDTIPFFYSWEKEQDNITGSGSSQDNVFSIDSLSAGTYSVTVTTPSPDTIIKTGIVLSESDSINLSFQTTIASSQTANDGRANVAVTGGTAPYMYEWFSNGILIGTGQALVNVLPAIYTVVVTDANGCKKMGEVVIEFVTNTHDPVWANSIKVYPNPNKGIFNIELTKKLQVELKITTMLGLTIYESDLPFGKKEFQLDNIPSGIYFLELLSEGEYVLKKLVIEK